MLRRPSLVVVVISVRARVRATERKSGKVCGLVVSYGEPPCSYGAGNGNVNKKKEEIITIIIKLSNRYTSSRENFTRRRLSRTAVSAA